MGAVPDQPSKSLDLTGPLQRAIAEAEELIANAPFVRTEQDLLEGYAYLSGRIRMAMQMAFDHDLDRPLFINSTHQFSKQGLDNPDAVYFSAYLREGVEYVVRGRRGTSADLSFQVMGGAYSARLGGHLVAGLRRPRARGRRGRRFEFRYTAEPGAKTMIVREVFNDWDTEERGTLWIERVDTLGQPAKPLTQALLTRKYESRGTQPDRLDPDLARLPPLLPVQGAGQHPDRAEVHARRPGLAELLDRPLRAGRGRGDDRHRPGVRRLHLPGDPDRV